MMHLRPHLRSASAAVRSAARAAARTHEWLEVLEGRTLLSASPARVFQPFVDTSAPSATLATTGDAGRGATQYTFTVDYSDETAISAGTIGDDDIVVTGPNGFSQVATFVGNAAQLSDGPTVSALYAIHAPSSQGFGDADVGTYTVTATTSGAATDTSGNLVPAQAIGTFALQFPAGPDLALTDVTYAAGQYVDGGTIVVHATARNFGSTAVTGPFSFSVGLIPQQGSSTDELTLATSTVTQSINPGESVAVELSAMIPGGTTSGSYFLAAHLANPIGAAPVRDANLANNDVVEAQADVVVAQQDSSFPQIGGLDPRFGNGGVVKQDTHLQTTAAVAVQGDGKTIAVGLADGTSTQDFGVTRFNPDGTIDTTFGGPAHGGPAAGTVFTDFSGRDDSPVAVAVQPDGKILVLGTSTGANGGTADADIAVVRYNTDGSLDTTFGTGGIIRTSIGPSDVATTDLARGLWLQGTGNFLVCGQSNAAGNGTDFAVLRYTPAGVLDSTFGNGGIVLTDFGGGDDGAYALAVDPKTGTIVVGGSTTPPGGKATSFAVARYNRSGELARHFGDGGKVVQTIGLIDDEAYAIALDKKLRVVAAGSSLNDITGNSEFAAVRFTPRGLPDPTFGRNGLGYVTIDYLQPAVANQVSIDPSGNVLLSGATVSSLDSVSPNHVSVALAQLTSNGQADPRFGGAGIRAGVNVLNFDTLGSDPPPVFQENTVVPAGVRAFADSQSQQALEVLARQRAIAVTLSGELVIVAASADKTAIAHVIGSGADLVSTIQSDLTDQAVSGSTRGNATLTLSNTGNRPIAGTADLALYVSLDQTVSPDDVAIATFSGRKINLQPGVNKGYKVKFVMPANLALGNYFLVGKVETAAPQITTANDNSANAQQTLVVPPEIDLSGPALADPPAMAAGQKSRLAITIRNDGNVTAKGAIEVKVVAATAATPGAGDAVLADLPAMKIKLAPGGQKTFSIKIAVPGDLAAGTYFLLATVGGGIDAADPTPANNLLTAVNPLVISSSP